MFQCLCNRRLCDTVIREMTPDVFEFPFANAPEVEIDLFHNIALFDPLEQGSHVRNLLQTPFLRAICLSSPSIVATVLTLHHGFVFLDARLKKRCSEDPC